MRLIGKFRDEELARSFSTHLAQLEIDNQIAIESDGTYEIWVISEDDVKGAEQLLGKFRESTGEEEVRDISKKGQKIRKPDRKEVKKKKQDLPAVERTRGKIFKKGLPAPRSVTLFFILISVLMGLFSGLGENVELLRRFFITDIVREGTLISWHRGLPEIGNGEYWRLITPIFIHFSILHLLFNMLWFYSLGNMIESRKGSWFLGIFIFFTAAAGNLAQYLVSHPYFGGMSGVVYGLLGYAWMKSKHDPKSKILLHKGVLYVMIGWFFLCLTGLLGNVANTAHAMGLIIGVVWGFLSSIDRKKSNKK